jgi:dethiobiotin synthetase
MAATAGRGGIGDGTSIRRATATTGRGFIGHADNGTLRSMRKPVRGLFITGTDTGVGKTYVAAMIARQLSAEGRNVGVYKPAASGCLLQDGALVAEDAVSLWTAAGSPGPLDKVCPQRFVAPLAPHRAAEVEGKQVDSRLLRSGLDFWLDRSEIVIVEGAGGYLSPITDSEFVADLACDLGFPLVIVSKNVLGTINQTLQTVMTARIYRGGLPIAGIVLNSAFASLDDESVRTNRADLERHADAPILAEVIRGGTEFLPPVDWYHRAATAGCGGSAASVSAHRA